MVWRYKRYYTDKKPKIKKKKKSMNMIASGASELRTFSHAKTAISLNIFVGTSDFVSETFSLYHYDTI